MNGMMLCMEMMMNENIDNIYYDIRQNTRHFIKRAIIDATDFICWNHTYNATDVDTWDATDNATRNAIEQVMKDV